MEAGIRDLHAMWTGEGRLVLTEFAKSVGKITLAPDTCHCEQVPSLPAWAIRMVLDDPLNLAQLFVWRWPWDEKIEDAMLVKRVVSPACFPDVEAIELRRSARNITEVHVFRRPMPRNGGYDILMECPDCRKLRRTLYGRTAGVAITRSAFQSEWRCCTCAGLRYASEGSALLVRSRGIVGKIFGIARAPRPKSWLPLPT